MKISEIIFVLLRLIAVWIFLVLAVPNIYTSVFHLSSSDYFPNKTEVIFFYAAQAFTYFCISIILWFFTDKISAVIYNQDSEINSSIKKELFVEISISVIGIFLISTNLPSFIANLYSLFTEKMLPAANSHLLTKYLIQSTAGIVIGIVLVVGKVDVRKLVKKVKIAGVDKEE